VHLRCEGWLLGSAWGAGRWERLKPSLQKAGAWLLEAAATTGGSMKKQKALDEEHLGSCEGFHQIGFKLESLQNLKLYQLLHHGWYFTKHIRVVKLSLNGAY